MQRGWQQSRKYGLAKEQMKIRRVFCSMLIFTNSGISNPFIPMAARPIQLLRRAVSASVFNVDHIANGAKSIENLETTKNIDQVEKLSLDATHPSSSVKSVSTADPDCPPTRVRRRRNVLLVRRGCPGAVGKGFVNVGEKFVDAGERLIDYDKYLATLSRKEKAQLLLKKLLSGAKKTVVVPTKAVLGVAKKVGKGGLEGLKLVGGGLIFLVWKLGEYGGRGLRLIARGFVHGWGKIGKGLAATGKAVQKAGDKMQAHAASRLHKPQD